MDEREYNRQATKLEYGSKTVLCTPWEDAGKMDAVTFQATSAATSALMTTFLSVQVLRRKLEHAFHVLQECHVGAETGIVESDATQPKSGMPPLWETHLTIASEQTNVVLENIKNGLDEMIKKFSSALRSVEPVLVLRSARDQVQREIQRPFETRCGPSCGTVGTPTDGVASTPSTSPRVPVLPPSRPWSSNSLSARVARAISRAGSTKETVQLLLESSAKRRIAEIAERHLQAQAESPSPRPNRPERTRVQVIKRTKAEAQTLLEKFDVASVTPSPKVLVRGALHDDGKAVDSVLNTPEKLRAEVIPKRVAVTIPVPPVAASSAAYGAKLGQAMMSIDQKASAVLMLKADRNLYRTLSVEERQLVLEHEKHEQMYHHNHAILNMKIVGGQFSLKKLKREAPGSNLEKDVEKSIIALEHQKGLLEEERARQVKLTCIELARHKRHLPQV